MERLEYVPSELGRAGSYALLNACVVPRPIAWVSTLSADGVHNLAPHSFFTISSVEPPVVQFTSVGIKDSLRNVRETGEFVVCVATAPLLPFVNQTGTDFPADLAEHEQVGLTLEPSVAVKPARIAESPIALECRSVGERDFGSSVVVFGEVVHVAISTAVADADGRPEHPQTGTRCPAGEQRLGRARRDHRARADPLCPVGRRPPRLTLGRPRVADVQAKPCTSAKSGQR